MRGAAVREGGRVYYAPPVYRYLITIFFTFKSLECGLHVRYRPLQIPGKEGSRHALQL